MNGTLSEKFNLGCGVPRGSCLGPLLFIIYANPLFDILKSHLPSVHPYAHDTQLYISFNPADNSGEVDTVTATENCIHEGWYAVLKWWQNWVFDHWYRTTVIQD